MSRAARRLREMQRVVPVPAGKYVSRRVFVEPHGDPPRVVPLRICAADVVVECPWCGGKHRYNRIEKQRHRWCDAMDRADGVGFVLVGEW